MNGVGVLVELAKALGLGKKDGATYGNGDLDWGWMVDPVGTARVNLNGAGRDNLVLVLKELLGTAAATGGWYGIGGGQTAYLVVDNLACDDIEWSANEVDLAPTLLRLGIGAKRVADPKVSARCWLLGLGKGGDGGGPFLFGSAPLGPEIELRCTPSEPIWGLRELALLAGSQGQRQIQMVDFGRFAWPAVGTDVDQLDPLAAALFLLKTYARWCASKGEGWAESVTGHLFVALGSLSDPGYGDPRAERENIVPPFPGLFDAEWPAEPNGPCPTPTTPSGDTVAKWLISLAPEAGWDGINADAAATFLLQLIWFITGKEPKIGHGSRVVTIDETDLLRFSGSDVVTLSAWKDGWQEILQASSMGVTWVWSAGDWQIGVGDVTLSLNEKGLGFGFPFGDLGPLEVHYKSGIWTLRLNNADPIDSIGPALKAALEFPTDPLRPTSEQVLSWIGDQIPTVEISDASGSSAGLKRVESEPKLSEFTLDVTLSAGKEDVCRDDDLGVYLRSASLAFTGLRIGTLSGFPPAGQLSLMGLRLPFDQATGGTPMASTLLPSADDPKTGINLDLTWDAGFTNPRVLGDKVIVIPVQEQIGPVALDSIRVALNTAEAHLDIDFDLTLDLAGVGIHPQGLGLGMRLPSEGEKLTACLSPHLRGLGVSVEAAGISASGAFVEHQTDEGAVDYLGAAQIRFWGYHLDGIGAFGGGGLADASMFVFAGMRAPLGGTPDFFLTGLAGGFGYNRGLSWPEVKQIESHPFLQVLNGTLDVSDIQENLGDHFPISQGSGWFAAGLTFRSYGVIDGLGLLSVGVGAEPKVGLIGIAGLDLGDLARLKMVLDTEVNLGADPYLYISLGLTSDSELLFGLIHPHGQGAYKQWFERGFAVLTIGGYDPNFSPPKPSVPSEAWPDAERIGFSAGWGPLSIDVNGYVAVIPREIQFGLSVEGSLDFGWVGLSAWVRSYSTVRWDPLYIDTSLSIGLSLWVDTCVYSGSWDLSLDMALWGPPFGGRFEVDVVVDTLEINVGGGRGGAAPPSIQDVVRGQLGLTVVGSEVQGITKNTSKGAFHLDILKGGVLPEGGASGGLDSLRVEPEFILRLDSALPAHQCTWGVDRLAVDGGGATSLEIVPSEHANLGSTLDVRMTPAALTTTMPDVSKMRVAVRSSAFPTALFTAVGVNPSKGGQTIRLDHGLTLDATLSESVLGVPACRALLGTEVGSPRELPLGQPDASPASTLSGLRAAGPPLRRAWTRSPIAEETQPVGSSVTVLSRLSIPALSDPAPRGLPTIAIARAPRRSAPTPGARRAALGGLRLDRVPVSPVPLPRPTPVDRRTFRRAAGTEALEAALLGGGQPLVSGEALLLEVTGSCVLRGVGSQAVRLLCVGSDDRMLLDEVQAPGVFAARLPVGTRRALIQGLGTPDLRRSGTCSAGFTAEAPLVRLGGRGWAGPGVVVARTDELLRPFRAVSTIRASDLLRGATQVELGFSALSGGLAVVTSGVGATVRATGATLGAVESIRVSGGLLTVYPVNATRRWRLYVQLPRDAAVLAVLARAGDPGVLGTRLRVGRAALEDPVYARSGSTTLTMERT